MPAIMKETGGEACASTAAPGRAQLAGARRLCRDHLRIIGLGLTEARPVVQIMFVLRLTAGAATAAAAAGSPHPARVVLACLSWWLVIVWAYLFNGVRDIREDRLNGSRRPIASGRLPATMAHYMAVACAVLAVVSGVALGGVVGLLVPAMVVLGYAYSARPFSLKSRPVGSPAFAFTLGISSYYAGYAACVGGYPTPDRSFVVLAVAASLWTALVGSIAKDLPDVGGDAAAGRRSLTVIAGDRTARLSLSGAALAVGGVFCVLAETTAAALMPAAVAALAGAVAVSVIGLSEFSRGSRSRRRRPYRAFMCTQYCVHILVVVSATVP